MFARSDRHHPLFLTSLVVTHLVTGVALADPEWRTIDGTNNNRDHPEWGSVGTQLLRQTTVSYADGVSAPAGPDRPSARLVTNLVCAQEGSLPNLVGATDFLWQWGQFIDHDTTLVDLAQPLEPFDIRVPLGDPLFDPEHTGQQVIHLERSAWDPGSRRALSSPREQVESITAYIDGSQVYGSNLTRANALRAHDGTGRLATSDGNLLPFNVDGLPNLGGPDPSLFLAGDIRANEQVALTAMHTLWMREHNRLADRLRRRFPSLPGDEIYERARALVGAEIQAITYREFLPILIGPDALPPYTGYGATVNAAISNVFSNAYRVGHTVLSPMILRLDEYGETIPEGSLALRDVFFAPERITDEGGIAPILRGLAGKRSQNVDPFVIDDVRNFLFGEPGAGGFDLPALNIQRGRDHGLPTYNQTRRDFGLTPARSFSEISSSVSVAQSLADAYDDVEDVDLWIGGIAEDHVAGAVVGELFRAIIVDQFERLRNGDRFWYQNVFAGRTLQRLESVRLSDIIRWNTEIGDELADDVFRIALPAGDYNRDGAVDVADLVLVMESLGAPDYTAHADDDGLVDECDLLAVIENWGPAGDGR